MSPLIMVLVRFHSLGQLACVTLIRFSKFGDIVLSDLFRTNWDDIAPIIVERSFIAYFGYYSDIYVSH